MGDPHSLLCLLTSGEGWNFDEALKIEALGKPNKVGLTTQRASEDVAPSSRALCWRRSRELNRSLAGVAAGVKAGRSAGVQPGVQPTSQPASQPGVQLASQPGVQPGVQPVSQPASQPSVQTASQPGAQPKLQPVNQKKCNYEPDSHSEERRGKC
ncbi:methionine-rich protein-like [Bicyclus anynana]|uniref:Methionine-rich protein-like n=1 Tax=Bicyclus anynana TaxID=110368 RepID=A0ABM3M820_BICAN|nr:methionine-rich protein-like [Bicyclus anynana]